MKDVDFDNYEINYEEQQEELIPEVETAEKIIEEVKDITIDESQQMELAANQEVQVAEPKAEMIETPEISKPIIEN